jgi:hypothetical protein
VGKRQDATILYFIQCNGDDGPIKIGTTGDIERRLVTLRTCNPYDLAIIHAVESDDACAMERDLLVALRPHRIRGEWFAPEPVFAHLKKLLPGCEFPLPAAVKADLQREWREETATETCNQVLTRLTNEPTFSPTVTPATHTANASPNSNESWAAIELAAESLHPQETPANS